LGGEKAMKKVRGWLVAATPIVTLLVLSGCATIVTLTEPETNNKIFSGTIRHIENKCAHGICLDMPFSLVVDAVVTPITIPWTAYNYIRPEEKQKPIESSGNEK
jgi:uncharacterized protein YceK